MINQKGSEKTLNSESEPDVSRQVDAKLGAFFEKLITCFLQVPFLIQEAPFLSVQ